MYSITSHYHDKKHTTFAQRKYSGFQLNPDLTDEQEILRSRKCNLLFCPSFLSLIFSWHLSVLLLFFFNYYWTCICINLINYPEKMVKWSLFFFWYWYQFHHIYPLLISSSYFSWQRSRMKNNCFEFHSFIQIWRRTCHHLIKRFLIMAY